MQSSLFAILLLLVPFIFASSSYSNEESDLLSNNDRFARDLELRKKFAFAFAKRSAPMTPNVDDVLVEARAGGNRDAAMRFAFAKRRAPKEFARFARASFA